MLAEHNVHATPMLRRLLTMMFEQARAVPSDLHSDYVSHTVDALTLRAALYRDPRAQGRPGTRLGRHPPVTFAQSVESMLRSLNNIQEPLHQSFWFYLLMSPGTYVSIGDYMISFGAVAAPPLLLMARDTLAMASDNGVSARRRRRLPFALLLALA